eukprot:PhF_6_TR30163/c0_g1_i1/m.44214/K08794/CAMK1; calcium/calmodulin-dependent protein kinase I
MNLADFAEAAQGFGTSKKKGGRQSTRVITDYYDMLEELGHGAFGNVYKASKKDTGLIYAVKHIDKKKAGSKGLSEVYSEVEMLSLLDHQYIVRLEETFDDPSNLYIVMEFVPGGEVQTKLKELGRFPENTVKKMTLCLLLAVEYLHRKGIVHRDLKPANCLLSDSGDVELKLADFGFAVMIGQDACLKSFCGTTTYMAPEILLDKNYGKPVDMWAVGVITYVLLSGTYPFVGANNSEMIDKIIDMKYEFPEDKWAGISLGAKEFVSKLLVFDQTRRMTARDALRHIWVQTGISEDDWEYYGLEKGSDGSGGGGGGGGPRRKHPRLRWRGAVCAVRAVHRVVYFVKCRRYKREGIDFPFTHHFGFMVSGVYTSRSTVMNVAGLCAPCNLKVLNVVLDMVKSSPTVDTFDISNNGIDSLDYVQNLVTMATTHPALTSINLEGNPIPPLAGRSLVRLARTATKLRVINVKNTNIGAEVQTQIIQSLKDNEKKRSKVQHPSTPATPHHHTNDDDDHSHSTTRLPIIAPHSRSTPTLMGLPKTTLGRHSSNALGRLGKPF